SVQKADPHFPQTLVDVRIVDDFAGDEEASLREAGSSLVGVVNSAVDAVAEPEFAGEAEREVAGAQGELVRLQVFHDAAAIVLRQLSLDLGLQPEAAGKILGISQD